MITANELRVGNWVLLNGDPLQMDGSGIEYCEMRVDVAAKFSGIPLTQEVLERCGFEKKLLGDVICHVLPYVRPLSTNKTPKHDIVVIHFADATGTHEGKYAIAIREHDRNIQFGISTAQHLHELQNLYFALTKQDLQYNP